MRTLIATDLPFGAMFGVLDVAVPAFAKAEGSPAAAGAVFAALAVGSMVGGIVYGRRTAASTGAATRPWPRSRRCSCCRSHSRDRSPRSWS